MSSDRLPLRKAGDADVHPSDIPASDLNLGGTTSDSVITGKKDKPVKLEIRLPKSLRKSLRKEAEDRGISVDAVVVEALTQRRVRP